MSRPVFLSRSGPREQTGQTRLIQGVKALGGKACKIEGEAGLMDTLVKIPGEPARLIELKRFGKEPEPHQVDRAKEWADAGMEVGWLAGAADVELFLRDRTLRPFLFGVL